MMRVTLIRYSPHGANESSSAPGSIFHRTNAIRAPPHSNPRPLCPSELMHPTKHGAERACTASAHVRCFKNGLPASPHNGERRR